MTPVKPGMLDDIRYRDRGPVLVRSYDHPDGYRIASGHPRPAETGGHRDCPACTCPRDRHHGWGCPCGCPVSIVRLTPVRRMR